MGGETIKRALSILVLSIFLAGLLTSGISCTKTEAPKTIDYQVIGQGAIPGIGMTILVSENATKADVLALANSLRSKYLSGGYISIDIFDSLEAYNHRDDMTYPEAEYWKHYLVNIVRNPSTGYDKVYWAAEGRDH